MDKLAPPRAESVCPRCRVVIKRETRQCPHCGERISTSKAPIYMGIVGLLALLFVGFLMLQTIKDSDLNTPNDDQTVEQQATPPDRTPPLNK
jgi:hypothetical protein